MIQRFLCPGPSGLISWRFRGCHVRLRGEEGTKIEIRLEKCIVYLSFHSKWWNKYSNCIKLLISEKNLFVYKAVKKSKAGAWGKESASVEVKRNKEGEQISQQKLSLSSVNVSHHYRHVYRCKKLVSQREKEEEKVDHAGGIESAFLFFTAASVPLCGFRSLFSPRKSKKRKKSVSFSFSFYLSEDGNKSCPHTLKQGLDVVAFFRFLIRFNSIWS